MICSNCGAKNQDNAKHCTNCGEAFAKPNNLPGAPDPAKKRKLQLILAAAGGGVLLLIVVLLLLLSGNGAKKTAKSLYGSVVEMDMNAIVELLPPAVTDYYTESLDFAHSEFEITDTRDLSRERVEEIDALYGIEFGTPEGYIEEATVVYVRVVYHGTALSGDDIPLVMISVDGDWYLDPLTTAEELDGADFAYDFSSILP